MASPTIQIIRGLEANLPGLRIGEPALTTDHHNFYVGIGSTTQNNKFFGSHRYWRKEDTGVPSQLKLVPGTEGVANQYLALQVPDAGYAGINTYIFPAVNTGDPTNTLTLDSVNGGVYTLSWQPAGAGGSSGLITIQEEGGTVGTASSISTINFVGGAILAEAAPQPNGIATVTVAQASTSQEGTARFSSSDFDVNSGLVSLASDITFTDATFSNITVGGAATVTGAVDLNGGLDVSGGETILSSATISDLTSGRVVYAGASGSLIDSTNLTFNGTSFTVGTGVGITQFSDDDTLGGSSSTTVPTENAVKTYVDAQITAQDLDFSGDSGTSAVDLDSQTFTISGTANEIETSASGQTLTVGLPNTVVVTTELEVPTLEVATIQHTNNTTALTIDTSGNVTAAQNFTITGNLFVNGTTTQVNTTSLTVEDSLIELGVVNGSVPASDLNVDLGFIMNWYDSQLRRASVFWDDSAGRIAIAQDVSESSSTLTVNDWAAVEMGEVWMNDIGGQNAVMSYLSSDTLYTGQPAGRYLQNITVDGGEF